MSAIQPQVTTRILDLLRTAQDALRQAEYEGSHYLRQDPEPSTDSPWTTPDLPADIRRELSHTIGVLNALREKAVENYQTTRGDQHARMDV